jgi:hypothetical protein
MVVGDGRTGWAAPPQERQLTKASRLLRRCLVH